MHSTVAVRIAAAGGDLHFFMARLREIYGRLRLLMAATMGL